WWASGGWPDHEHFDRGLAAADVERAVLEAVRGGPGPDRRIDTDQQFAGSGRRCQAGCRVYDIAEGREVVDRAGRSRRPDVGDPGVDAAAKRDGAARGGVGPADAFDQLPSCRDRGGSGMRPGHPAEEEADDLVADELVDEPVVGEDRLRPDLVEMAEE